MITILRFVGVMNAAVWLGGSAFFVLAIAPAFSSTSMTWLLGDLYAGGAALLLWKRFYALQYICIGLALLHLLAEWVYLGRGMSKTHGWFLSLLLGLTLGANLELQQWVAPAHWARNSPKVSVEDRARAQRNFPLWSSLWNGTNLLLGLGAVVFAWRTITAPQGPRFVTQTKFRTPDSLDA